MKPVLTLDAFFSNSRVYLSLFDEVGFELNEKEKKYDDLLAPTLKVIGESIVKHNIPVNALFRLDLFQLVNKESPKDVRETATLYKKAVKADSPKNLQAIVIDRMANKILLAITEPHNSTLVDDWKAEYQEFVAN